MIALAKQLVMPLIYFAGIVVFLIAITGKVRYGLLFLVPLLPLQNIMEKFKQFPLGKDFNDILLIGMLIGWMIYKKSRNQPLFDKSPFNKLIILYGIFTYITLWSGASFLGLPAPLSLLDVRVQNWKNYMILPLLFLLTYNNIENKKEIKRLFFLMCCAIVIMNYYLVQQISWMGSWFSREKMTGTFEWLGINETAAFYAIYTFILVGLFFFVKKTKFKIALGVLIFVNLYCILFIFSRGAYIATLAGFLIISMLKKRILIVPIILLLLFWQSILPPRVIERIQYTEHQGQMDESARKRIILWQDSLSYFAQNPVFGIGFNTFYMMNYKMDTHNVFLRTLAEQGIIGFGFLVTFMLLAFKKGFRLFCKAKDTFLKGLGLGFCASVVSLMVVNFFGDRWSYLPLAAFFWVFLGMVERGNLITNLELTDNVSVKNGTRKNKKN